MCRDKRRKRENVESNQMDEVKIKRFMVFYVFLVSSMVFGFFALM